MYSWNDTTSKWVFYSKGEYAYDASGNRTLNSGYNWDETTSQWVGNYKNESTYDASGNRTLDISYNWDETTSQWVGFWKYELTYDANGKQTVYIQYSWDSTTSQWVASSKATYYYSEHNITFIPEIPKKHIIVYPNPAKDFIVFDLTNSKESAIVEIFDIQGKKVLEQKLSENKQIFVSNLPKGQYMYKLNDDGIIYKGKLLIE